MDEGLSASSFRDPSGFLYEREGRLYRQVELSFKDHYDLFMSSGLYRALVDDGLLIPHDEVDIERAYSAGAYKVLEPERIPFISYPYEWCFGELKDAALTTMRVQQIAMDHGMSLRDASAYNIQFRAGKPILIDTLSFEALREGEPWVAYRQFCQHFLAPLALMSTVDVRLGQLLRVHIDGVPLDLASGLLPRRTRFKPSLGLHIHAHAKSQKRHAGESVGGRRSRRSFSTRALRGLIESLQSAVRGLSWEPEPSVWRDYYDEAGSYTDESIRQKREIVAKFLADADPNTVWDLGANTGMFGRIAADRGIPTVCFEMDPSCVEINYRTAVEKNETHVLPLVLDLTNPSPSIGWASVERSSIGERGPADLAMALALVHHLAIGNNVPLDRVADFFADISRWLIIEWVPKDDPKVQLLLSSREDVFGGYTPSGFEAAFRRRFSIERRGPIPGSGRVLYLMKGADRV